jgi:hypothetical protein
MSRAVCKNEKSNIGNPYKTCRLWRLLTPRVQKWSQKVSKKH